MVREVVLDTETTGLSARNGDRLIELACVEIVGRLPTGRNLHLLIDPQDREVHPDALAIHGISNAMLKGKPVFSAVVDEFLAFIETSTLVIHNASFDVGFLNAELKRVGKPAIEMDRVVDTLVLARRRHPAGPNSLDALCKRYKIDASDRTKHGALIDSQLLAAVYIELLGERQAALGLSSDAALADRPGAAQALTLAAKARPSALAVRLTADDIAHHRAFTEKLGPDAIWRHYEPEPKV